MFRRTGRNFRLARSIKESLRAVTNTLGHTRPLLSSSPVRAPRSDVCLHVSNAHASNRAVDAGAEAYLHPQTECRAGDVKERYPIQIRRAEEDAQEHDTLPPPSNMISGRKPPLHQNARRPGSE